MQLTIPGVRVLENNIVELEPKPLTRKRAEEFLTVAQEARDARARYNRDLDGPSQYAMYLTESRLATQAMMIAEDQGWPTDGFSNECFRIESIVRRVEATTQEVEA